MPRRKRRARAPEAVPMPTDPESCTRCRKVVYLTFADASRMADAYSARRKRPYRVYPCPGRYGWHLTTQPSNAPLFLSR